MVDDGIAPEDLLRLARETGEALRDWGNKAPKMANTQDFGQAYHRAQDLVKKAESLIRQAHGPSEAPESVSYYLSDAVYDGAVNDFQNAGFIMSNIVKEAANLADCIHRMQIPVALAHHNLMRLVEALERKARFPESR
jgi:hypothetical protein